MKQEEVGDSFSKVTAHLDQYLQDETVFKSTVETIKKLYRLSKSKGEAQQHTCFLCKSSINDQSLASIETNFLKKDQATVRN